MTDSDLNTSSPTWDIPAFVAGDEYGVEYSEFSQQPMQSRLAFWDSLHPWFHEQGYTLYTRHETRLFPSILKTPPSLTDPYPYAVVETDYVSNPWRLRTCAYGNVCFAQEKEGNHVAVKYIQAGSQEYKILRLIIDSCATCAEENCLIPVLALLPEPDGLNWFVVMPRWGGPGEIQKKRDRTVGDLLLYIESTVKALAFLHAHNIVHRDIKLANLFPNHIQNALMDQERPVQRQARMRYATADFDLSLILPHRVGEQRLPWKYTRHSYSILTGHYAPRDIYKGELTYDPYAFDVGMLGGMLSLQLQNPHTKSIPLLAPLLDRMTTHKVGHRFTAAEALDFVQIIKQEHANELYKPLDRIEDEWGQHWDDDPNSGYDRWEGLPPEFVQHWTSKGYRTPQLSRSTKVMRRICGLKLAGTRIEIGRYPLMGLRRVCNTFRAQFK